MHYNEKLNQNSTMAYKRHTDFYIPVLKTLEDLKEHEVNNLIEETALYCNLSETERKERTRKGTQLKYESNIQWAITDLCQGAFIERTSRGIYKIAFDGLLMLEDNPTSPNRDYLEARSEKFKEFRYRKSKRNRTLNIEEVNIFSNLSDEDIETDVTPDTPIAKVSDEEIRANALDLIEKYINLKKAKEALKMNTEDEDEIINMLRGNLIKKLLSSDIEEFSDKLNNRQERGYAILFDYLDSDEGKVYWITDADELSNLTNSSLLIFENQKPKINQEVPDSNDESKKQRKEKAASRKIKVWFEDGTVFDDKYAADVFAKSIEKIGANKIQKLGIYVTGFPLIGTKAPEKYQYKVINGGYYIPVNSSTETKKRLLEEISNSLGLKIKIEMG